MWYWGQHRNLTHSYFCHSAVFHRLVLGICALDASGRRSLSFHWSLLAPPAHLREFSPPMIRRWRLCLSRRPQIAPAGSGERGQTSRQHRNQTFAVPEIIGQIWKIQMEEYLKSVHFHTPWWLLSQWNIGLYLRKRNKQIAKREAAMMCDRQK